MNHPNHDANDSGCRDCAHMNYDRDGARWCSSPQAIKGIGHSIRCVWERDHYVDHQRDAEKATRKCGPSLRNFVRREAL